MKRERGRLNPAEIEAAELELEALNHQMAAAEEQKALLAAREAEAREKHEQAKAEYRQVLVAYRTLIYATVPDLHADIDATRKRLAKLKREGSKGPTRDAQGRLDVATANLKQKRGGS